MRITLEKIKEDFTIFDQIRGKLVRIWSGEHFMYWRPDAAGYTPDGLEAGVWLFEKAWSITNHCDPSKKIEFRTTS